MPADCPKVLGWPGYRVYDCQIDEARRRLALRVRRKRGNRKLTCAQCGRRMRDIHAVYGRKVRGLLAESNHQPFGHLTPLTVLKANPDGGGIVQAIGPLKMPAAEDSCPSASSRRFPIVTGLKDQPQVVLRQAGASSGR